MGGWEDPIGCQLLALGAQPKKLTTKDTEGAAGKCKIQNAKFEKKPQGGWVEGRNLRISNSKFNNKNRMLGG